MLNCPVQEKDSGKTVERILKKRFGISSSHFVYLKHNSKLFLNEAVCKSVDICKTGDVLSVDVSENLDAPPENFVLWDVPLEILFEDDFLLVVNKPSDMACHPCLGNFENTLANAVMNYWAKKNGVFHNFHIANRLDKDTSGICVIAKNRYAHSVLSQQIKTKVFERRYMAVIHGVMTPNEGIIEAPIKRCDDSVIKRIVHKDGKYAKTYYKTTKVLSNNLSVVEICLETGRTHQIRVHFSHIGHPLVGDWLYGNGDKERELASRQALHAGYVAFLHPVTKAKMVFETKMPDDLNKLFVNL